MIREDSIQSELIQNNYGVSYPIHLKKIRKLFEENGLFVPKLEDIFSKTKNDSNEFYDLFYDLKNFKEEEFRPDFSFLKKNTFEENQVYLCHVRTIHKFYVQQKKFYENLQDFNEKITKYINNILATKEKFKVKNGAQLNESDDNDTENKIDLETRNALKYWERTILLRQKLNIKVLNYLKSICKSFYCIARLGSDYNRAQILEITEDERIKVFCVDYGDFAFVSVEEIFPILPKFIRLLPFQAIECSIDNIVPFNSENTEWSTESIDYFLSLTRDESDFYRNLFAEVVDTFDSRKYTVRLFKKSYPEHVDLSFEMVAARYAKLKSDEELRIFECLEEKNDNAELKYCPLSTLPKQFVNLFIR